MLLVAIKFIEVFTRAAFVVGTSYSLSLSGAGQFGIVATLVGLGAFAFNWERQVDIQRRFVDAGPAVFDRAVVNAMQFWGFNQLVMMPLFLIACAVMAHLTPWQLLLAAVIVSGEHVANQTYQLALISKRYWHFIGIVAVKNVAVLLAVLPTVLFAPSTLTLDGSMTVWAVGQLACAATVFALWARQNVSAAPDAPFSIPDRIFSQHRASFTHMQIGLVAILVLQFDRLVVGALVPLDQAGIYFRHILIVSFIYQFFNVAFYNRALPGIFAAAKTETRRQLQARLWRELIVIYALVVAGVAAGLAIDQFTGGAISAKYALSYALGLILVSGALIRVTADFHAAICHARMAERSVLNAQLVSFMIGGPALIALSWTMGIYGTAIASVAGSVIYLIAMAWAVHKIAQQATA
jgi:O-antigen/teichoic acid export membrane protein